MEARLRYVVKAAREVRFDYRDQAVEKLLFCASELGKILEELFATNASDESTSDDDDVAVNNRVTNVVGGVLETEPNTTFFEPPKTPDSSASFVGRPLLVTYYNETLEQYVELEDDLPTTSSSYKRKSDDNADDANNTTKKTKKLRDEDEKLASTSAQAEAKYALEKCPICLEEIYTSDKVFHFSCCHPLHKSE
jgi:hypothetical protein